MNNFKIIIFIFTIISVSFNGCGIIHYPIKGGAYKCHVKHPFLIAASKGDNNSVQEFVKDGININMKECKKTAISYSVRNNNYNMFKYLVDNGAKVNNTLLTLAICNNNIEMNEFFKKQGALKEPKNTKKALRYAIFKKNLKGVKYLVENGVQLNNVEGNEESLLSQPILNNDFEMLEFLIKNDADINHIKNVDHGTFFTLAIQGGNMKIIKLLVENGAKLNIANTWGKTELMTAAGYKNLEITKYLVENGADINMKDNWGKNAMDYFERSSNVHDKNNMINDFEKILK